MNHQSSLDFSLLPLVDSHCHLFGLAYQPRDPAAVFNMSLNPMPADQLHHTLVYRWLLKALREFLALENCSDEEVLRTHRHRLQIDYSRWVKDLFADAVIDTLLVDYSYQPAAVDLERFEDFAPAHVYYVFRIESLLDDIWPQLKAGVFDFREAEKRFFEQLERGLSKSGTVAIKSIIGYRTGLAVAKADRSAMIAAAPSEKQFRDYFLQESLAIAGKKGLPVQIHAAFGESNIDIRNNHPGLLKGLLEDPRFAEVRIVLVHGGYPRCFEAGYLASVYPNVYVDISEMFPFVPLGSRRGLQAILDMCPFNKIVYGSDGFEVPEIHWLAARMAKTALSLIFSGYVEAGLFTQDYAVQVAEMIFSETARKLYGLGSGQPPGQPSKLA